MAAIIFMQHITNLSLRRRANARNARISLRGPIHSINTVDKTKLSRNTPHRPSNTVSLETYPFIHEKYSDTFLDFEGPAKYSFNLVTFLLQLTSDESIIDYIIQGTFLVLV